MQQLQINHDPLEYTQENMAKKSRVSSRLAKKQQEKLAKQTAFLVGLAFLILAIFIFALIPILIRVTGIFVDTGLPGAEQDTVPPRPPSISAPPDATFSATVALRGFSEANSTVVVVVNGEELAEVTAEDDGTFEAEVSLQDEENEVWLYAVDQAENESELSSSYQIRYDTIPPTLELETVEDGQQVEQRKNQSLAVRGSTEPNAKVYLNDRLVFARSDGSFSTSFQLAEGDNELRFRVVDEAGNETEQTIQVSFRF